MTIEPLPCPFCGSSNLLTGDWYVNDEEMDAIECGDCAAGAPTTVWNKRHETTCNVYRLAGRETVGMTPI